MFNQQLELAKVGKWVADAFIQWKCPELISQTIVEFNNRFTARIADGCYRHSNHKGTIRLSLPTWPHLNDKQKRIVAIHEAAHVVVHYRYMRSQPAHGLRWQLLMWQMGLNPDRCMALDHQTSIKRKKTQQYRVNCLCPDGTIIGPVRAKRLQSGESQYKCTRCGTIFDKYATIHKI
jgi:predicted SprT family Zn-dependent metalloprotease